MDLLAPFRDSSAVSFTTTWKSPSNIAFVKYWGKKGHQLPANPSLSMTLAQCTTHTKVSFTPADHLSVELSLGGKKEERFAEKIKNYLHSLTPMLPHLKEVSVEVETSNTFPHGAGIASSASGLSAFALGLTDYLHHLSPQENFFERASFLSRLASGSACRSVYGGFTTWGECELAGSSDLFATGFDVHQDFTHLQDTVLVVNDSEKEVSSRAGHDRMKEHGFAEARFVEAKKNFTLAVSALRTGDVELLGSILENEALQLHAMMMCSPESFLLMKPNTIAAIELIRDFRRETKLPLYFTLDAGPNLHLIYPDSYKNKISTFITNELSPLCQTIIDDQCGEGPVRL